VLLEATPKGVDLGHVRAHILAVNGVTGCHDLHAWTITSGMPVLSAHVVLGDGVDPGPVLDALGACLAGHFDIEHSTFQLEAPEHRDHEHATHP
jgi:cobalt-zinc-cadmium efflux system protein